MSMIGPFIKFDSYVLPGTFHAKNIFEIIFFFSLKVC